MNLQGGRQRDRGIAEKKAKDFLVLSFSLVLSS